LDFRSYQFELSLFENTEQMEVNRWDDSRKYFANTPQFSDNSPARLGNFAFESAFTFHCDQIAAVL
jgi:hypothetical protein